MNAPASLTSASAVAPARDAAPTSASASASASAARATERLRLWDLPLRLFHWTLAAAVSLAWGLGKFGPDQMTLHFRVGYGVAGLLAFRLIWGLIGPRPARFATFVYGPRAFWSYLRDFGRRAPSFWRGHNPMGGAFVIALLAVLAAQVATGLMADPEDYVNTGPLAGAVGIDWARWALAMHGLLAWVLLAMVGLHVAVIGYYKRWKHEDLLTPMLTGWKTVRKDSQAAER